MNGWLWAGMVAGLLGPNALSVPVEPVRRDIRVSGRVTRSAAPAPGINISKYREFGVHLSLDVNQLPHYRPMARTDEHGRFEVVLNEPGDYFVCAGTPDGGTRLPRRTVHVPDSDVYFVELAEEEIAVAGIVVDEASGEPIAHARVTVMPKDRGGPDWSANSVAGPDGRFQLGAFAVGECELEAGAKGYARARLVASLPYGGDLRVALTRASMIKGRFVDADGYGIGGVSVTATRPDDREGRKGESLGDGSFEIGWLSPVPHNLCAGSARRGFALAGSVSPGEENVMLTLIPPGECSQSAGPTVLPSKAPRHLP